MDNSQTSDAHNIRFGIRRRGTNNNYGRRGGFYRESYAACSCGWEGRSNGQTSAESAQAAREHLKEVGVYTTPLEQTVYAHIGPNGSTLEEIVQKSEKTQGRVEKVLAKLVERGNVEVFPALTGLVSDRYVCTDKWFSWND